MKLHAKLKNERGGQKTTSDDTRILVELNYKNKCVGTVGLYSVTDNGRDMGYRVVWDGAGVGGTGTVIADETKGEKLQGKTAIPRCKSGMHPYYMGCVC